MKTSRSSSSGIPAVLWITPDAPSGAAMPVFEQSIDADHARSVYEALSRLDSRAYDAVVMHFATAAPYCLGAIASIRDEKRSLPILVVAGSADVRFAVDALRSGASHFRPEPCLPEEIVKAVYSLTAAAAPNTRALTTLASLLDRTAGVSREADVPIEGARRYLAAALAVSLSRSLQPRSVLACAAALRSVLRTSNCVGPREQAAHARRVLDRRLAKTSEPRTPLARSALGKLHDFFRNGRRPKEYEVAEAIGIQPEYLGRVLAADTGLTFGQWRNGISLMLAAREIVDTQNLISQIAYRVGYEHPSQLARDFESLVGTSPRGYRQLWAALDPDSLTEAGTL